DDLLDADPAAQRRRHDAARAGPDDQVGLAQRDRQPALQRDKCAGGPGRAQDTAGAEYDADPWSPGCHLTTSTVTSKCQARVIPVTVAVYAKTRSPLGRRGGLRRVPALTVEPVEDDPCGLPGKFQLRDVAGVGQH